MQSRESIIFETHPAETGGEILLLKLNRPDAMNSFSLQLLRELQEAVLELREKPEVRVLILSGAGRAFCTGADLKERKTMSPEQVVQFLQDIGRLFRDIETLPFPVIAAINGFALGGGLELALACDIRIAQENALLGLPETSLGIIPGAGGTQRLTRIIGLARSKELIFTARKFKAPAALELGILNQVFPEDNLLEGALELAAEICKNAPIAVRQAKVAINAGFDLEIDAALELERESYNLTLDTQDRLEALRAFQEKRKPVFKGE